MEIQSLKPEVVDQIAAGEVVERPAHLVKELVENSLDAGASSVEIELSQGGREVRVKDNGRGIFKEDLPLACSRHATSKVTEADDLWNLSTYGFRGEALASISSVSRLKISSKREGAVEAYSYENEFGKGISPYPAGAMDGTTVEIKDLFSNTPARLKFLKSDSAETTQIKQVVKALALAYPKVEFRLKQNNKLLLYYPQCEDLRSRAQQVLDLKEAYSVEHEVSGNRMEVIFSSPHETCGVRKNIWSFVQGRWVQDKSIVAAVMEAYRSLLMHGEYPFCVVQLSVDPAEVDVNIHPTKSQVKFTDNKQIFRLVHHPLREALEKAPWLATKTTGELRDLDESNTSVPSAPTFSVQEEAPQSLSFRGESFEKTQFSKKVFSPLTNTQQEVGAARVGMEELKRAANIEPSDTFSAVEVKRPQTERFWSHLNVLGQTHSTYILAESASSFYLIDQHAAHERVMFERLMSNWQNGKFETQQYLIPLSIDLNEEDVENLVQQSSWLERMGLMIEQSGPQAIVVTSAPTLLKEAAIVECLQKLAEQLASVGGGFSVENKVSELFSTMACHSSVRAGQILSVEQMKSLLEQMDEFAFSSYCPHGRNVYIEWPLTRIEKDFGRIV